MDVQTAFTKESSPHHKTLTHNIRGGKGTLSTGIISNVVCAYKSVNIANCCHHVCKLTCFEFRAHAKLETHTCVDTYAYYAYTKNIPSVIANLPV
jgi:hypothetical protein